MWNIMSSVCCTEFTRWVKSFTKTEKALTVVEAVLLVVLIALLILLILHLIVCSKLDHWADEFHPITFKITTDEDQEEQIDSPTTESGQHLINNRSKSANGSTTKLDIKCSWTPSAKTTAEKHYYEDGHTQGLKSFKLVKSTHIPWEKSAVDSRSIDAETTIIMDSDPVETTTPVEDFDELVQGELSDGEKVEDEYDRYILALVKLKPPKDILFGCILTIVSEYWTLTAASCIEAIEEMDSLDSFVIMEHYGTDKKGQFRAVNDVQIHPLFEGRNWTYDLAALKSDSSLTASGTRAPVELASFLDFALLTLAEKFIILGYGAFRSIEGGPSGRRLRRAHVYSVPARRCARGGGAALRHLSGGRAVPRGACGAPALCAGPLRARALPCTYCAGTPLLLESGRALGLMAHSAQCGAACEPALYVNLADGDVADWLDATLRSDVIQ